MITNETKQLTDAKVIRITQVEPGLNPGCLTLV